MTSQPNTQGQPELSDGERIPRDEPKQVRKMRWIGAGRDGMPRAEELGGTEPGQCGPERESGAWDARLRKAASELA
jgi:hypothetical protein